MPHANFILSTTGTALLTNQASTFEERQKINRCSNLKDCSGMLAEERTWLEGLIKQARQLLSTADLMTVARMSAELNGLIKFYGGYMKRNRDEHILLCTDTWVGKQVAELEAEWLRQFCGKVEVQPQKDLQTAELDTFQLALSDLVKWSDEVLPGYSKNGYHVVFNLTAGFKSVQGFLQTLAMFYADEVVYVFQEADSLMRIPRLPIKLAADDTVRDFLNVFRRLDRGLEVEDTSGVPETMLMRIGGQTALSPWGSLVWEQTRKKIYCEKLWPPPSSRTQYGKDFEDSLRSLPKERLGMVNAKIDALVQYLEKGLNPPSLDFKELRGNPRGASTHEMDAWSDQDAKRIFGHFENDTFVLEQLGKALH